MEEKNTRTWDNPSLVVRPATHHFRGPAVALFKMAAGHSSEVVLSTAQCHTVNTRCPPKLLMWLSSHFFSLELYWFRTTKRKNVRGTAGSPVNPYPIYHKLQRQANTELNHLVERPSAAGLDVRHQTYAVCVYRWSFFRETCQLCCTVLHNFQWDHYF